MPERNKNNVSQTYSTVFFKLGNFGTNGMDGHLL